ncbi:Bug family tripartite tricarboxylate transporter substrate binding protein [Pararoseomonas indoligenes]|uniref:Tripartite tricarboxylate transporter substrate binding protein n=1 Tax=Roseomonas indoligenes TaxID=2820811 RepID=A0A940MZJ7_9PROT|nr:tripartite tricarboxylate transporter substrate binding protein [Pararoseomonas indoligenes]MBP0493950.1 tripartite tricarboxylate transporter substrate binding protein [Pararoseomonas indoligenes]
MTTRRQLAGLIAAAALPLARPALAQSARIAEGPIRLVVPFPPGGPNDLVARVLGQKLGAILERNVVVENRSGAGGVIGTDNVVKAAPDGRSLCLTSAGAIAISPVLGAPMPFDVAKDVAPITLVALMPELLAVPPSLPVNSVAELVDYAKKNPGKVNYGSSGIGSMPHLAGEAFRAAAGIDITHVPYRGAAPAVTDLIAGQVQMMFADMPAMMSQVQGNALRPIALASGERSPLLPQTPTMAEAGVPVVADNWYGLVASSKVPAPIQALLQEAAARALRDPDLVKAYAEQGARPVGGSQAEFRDFIVKESARWGEVGRRANIRMD